MTIKINKEILHEISQTTSQILIVTKYWNSQTTQFIQKFAQENYPNIFFGLGENRINTLQEKQLPPKDVHFIGNIQSRQIPKIIKHCQTIHSLDSLKHAIKINQVATNLNTTINIFIQIHQDKNKISGIPAEKLPNFIQEVSQLEHLNLIGISGMGSASINPEDKKGEFQQLIQLRNQYLKDGLISAGTSRDYKIALTQKIDIVRIGQKMLDE